MYLDYLMQFIKGKILSCGHKIGHVYGTKPWMVNN